MALTYQSLPPELWIDILATVVHVPGFFDTEWDHHPSDLIWEGIWAEIVMDDQSAKMRKTIVQVSREWRDMGRRFLFEDLVFSSKAKISALATLFEQTSGVLSGEDNTDIPPAGYGRWAKRIAFRKAVLYEENIFPDLERLFRQCRQVQIIRVSSGGDAGSSASLRPISRLLQFRFPRCLRRIYLADMPHEDGSRHLLDHSDMPLSLYWASLPSNWMDTLFPDTIDSLPPASFLTLRLLEISIPSRAVVGIPAWDLPALRYLSISGLSATNLPSLLPLITANGPRLLGLSVWTSESERRAQSVLHKVLVLTTALRSIVFNDIDLDVFRPPSGSSFPSITHLGISTVVYDSLPDIARIRTGLAFIFAGNVFPNLSVFRILGEEDPGTLSRDWEEAIVTAARHGIRLEDRERRLLQYEVHPTAH